MLISDCEYYGDITAGASSEGPAAGRYAGGIIALSDFSYFSIIRCVTYGSVNAGDSDNSYAGGILGCFIGDEDYFFEIDSAVALQTSLTGQITDSFCTDGRNKMHLRDSHANSELLSGDDVDSFGVVPAALDSEFWYELGFDADHGWELIRTGSVSGNLEAHLVDMTDRYTITVTGGGVLYYNDRPLPAINGNTYLVFPGMELTAVCEDANYKTNQVKVNGVALIRPYRFTVTGDATVAVTLETNNGDFWVSNEYYIFGIYPENSTYGDFDWAESIDSWAVPISGEYASANIYVLSGDYGFNIDRLDLGGGSVICLDEFSVYTELYGCDDDSYLIADSIINNLYSGDIVISGLNVNVNSIYEYDSLYLYLGANVKAKTVTIYDNCCGIEIYDSELTAETIYAAVDPEYEYGYPITVYGIGTISAGEIIGTLDLWLDNEAIVTVSGNLTVTTEYGSILLEDNAVLNVYGTITADEVILDSASSVVLNAIEGSAVPYSGFFSMDYRRTTLTGLPVNTWMLFSTELGDEYMTFYARTDNNGELVAWLLPDEGTVTAMTVDVVAFIGDGAIGNGPYH